LPGRSELQVLVIKRRDSDAPFRTTRTRSLFHKRPSTSFDHRSSESLANLTSRDLRRERPCNRRAAEQRYKGAPSHSITSSARASTFDGMVIPSALAVLRLMIRSALVACWTGRSAGFSPLRILPV